MTSSTRVLFVLSYYAPHISGLTEAVRLPAERLARDPRFRVTVLAMRHAPDLALEENLAGVRVIRAKPLLELHKGMLSADYIAAYRRLVREHDIVHMHLPMLEAGLLSWLTPRSVPIVASWHCDMAAGPAWSVIDSVAIATVRASSAACCKRARAICVTSLDYVAGSAWLAPYQEKIVAVPPPDNAPEGVAPREPARDGDVKRIGFLGRFAPEKGLDVLLQAVPLVLARYPDAQFVLAGDHQEVRGGSEYGRLKRSIQALGATVVLPGRLPYETLFEFYRSLDVFVLPSVNAYEAFGIVQVEAMKAGVPVVASDLRGVRVPIHTTANGAIVEAGSPEALARAILQTIDKRYDPAAVAARAWAHFSTRLTTDALIHLYETATRSSTTTLAASTRLQGS